MSELKCVDGLCSIMEFLSDRECTELSSLGGPCLSHWTALFDALHQLQELDLALHWLSHMLLKTGARPSARIVNCLIALCRQQGQAARALKLFSAMRELEVAPDARTFAELIRVHVANQDMDAAHRMIDVAREQHCLSAMHYNALLEALAAQQPVEIF